MSNLSLSICIARGGHSQPLAEVKEFHLESVVLLPQPHVLLLQIRVPQLRLLLLAPAQLSAPAGGVVVLPAPLLVRLGRKEEFKFQTIFAIKNFFFGISKTL